MLQTTTIRQEIQTNRRKIKTFTTGSKRRK